MCELLCVGLFLIVPFVFVMAVLENKKNRGYCVNNAAHEWNEWEYYLEGRSRVCKKCGINEHE